jgi:hypothetical protein
MKREIISINLHQRKRNKISDIEKKEERNSSNFSPIKNNVDIVIQKNNGMKDKEKKNTVSSKEMTTTDQIENISNHKNSTNTYNINFSNKSFRFKHKSPNTYYQEWINQQQIDDDNFSMEIKNGKSLFLIEKKSQNKENFSNLKKKKSCEIF